MLRWVILAVAVVLLAAIGTVVVSYGTGSNSEWGLPASTSRSGPHPKVDIDGPLTLDFGTMATQKVGNHKWVVKNVGQGDLELWKAGSTCMCTIAKLSKDGDKMTVKPGESTEIELEWHTNDAVGDYAKGATIGTNDPERPEFQLNVHGIVHPPIVIMPPPQENVIMVGNVSSDSPGLATMALYSPDRPAMKLTKLTTSRPELIVPKSIPMTADQIQNLNSSATAPAKGGYRLDVEFLPGMPLGNFREELIIETDHPEQPRLQFTLVGSVSGPISVMPNILRLVVVNNKQESTGQVTMLVREGRPTAFKVTSKPDKLEVAITPNETPTLKGRYRVSVTVPAGTPPGLIEGEIVLETDHPKVKELKIPVNVVVGSG
jgi:hypothetical protein